MVGQHPPVGTQGVEQLPTAEQTCEPQPRRSVGMQHGVPIQGGIGQSPLCRQAVFWKGCPEVLLPMAMVLYIHIRIAPKDHKTHGGHGTMA